MAELFRPGGLVCGVCSVQLAFDCAVAAGKSQNSSMPESINRLFLEPIGSPLGRLYGANAFCSMGQHVGQITNLRGLPTRSSLCRLPISAHVSNLPPAHQPIDGL